MSGYSQGRRRRRAYTRKFDWEEARERRAAGETLKSIADSFGVNPTAVQRVCLLPEAFIERANDEQLEEVARPRNWNQDDCPTCDGVKSKMSAQCWACFAEGRLADIRLERLPAQRRVILAGVPHGRIVKCRGSWGVVEKGGHRHRKIDYFELPAAIVPDTEIVDVAPSWNVIVEGEVQEAEAIA